MLTAALVGEDQLPSEEAKKRAAGSATKLAGYSIPKKPKLSDQNASDNSNDTNSKAGTSNDKRLISNDEGAWGATLLGIEEMSESGTSYAFKKPVKRVARSTSCSREGTDKHELSVSSTSRKPIHRPRDDALPLGGHRKPHQPFHNSSSHATKSHKEAIGTNVKIVTNYIINE